MSASPLPYETPTMRLVAAADLTPEQRAAAEQEQAIAAIPAALRETPRWSTWRDVGGKKRPDSKVDDPSAWGSLVDAVARLRADPDVAGLGFLLGDGHAGIDIDGCRDPNTGEVDPRAQDIVDRCAAYSEVSPSGTGIKVFGRASLVGLEVSCGESPLRVTRFSGSRYFAVTGHGTGDPNADISAEIALLSPHAREGNASRAEPLPEVVRQGTRDTTLHREASRLRRLGWSESEMRAGLEAINLRCDPPLSGRDLDRIARSVVTKYEPAEDLFPTTETGDAEFFAAQNAEHVRYDHRQGRWLLFGAHHWREDPDGEMHRLALDSGRARQRAAIGNKERLRWAVGGEARKRQSNLLALAQNLPPLADSGEDWDSDPRLLGVANGVVDLQSGVLRPGRPEDRVTLVSPVAYVPDAPTARWRQFVLDICDGDGALADYLRVSFGYVLSGETGEQCFWILYGTGANGKSTLLETMTHHVLPRHSWSMNFPSQNWSESLSEYQRALVGRRLVVAKESEQAKRLNSEFMKSLTGDETISARHPYGRPFNFRPVAKFFLAVNHKPVIRDETHGMWRRVRLVPFLRQFPTRPEFAEALFADASAALAWAVDGAREYFASGLHTPRKVLDATREYQGESQALAPFLAERCVLGQGVETRAQQMFDAYRSWCNARLLPDNERLSQNEFGARIKADPRIRVDERTGKPPKRGVFYVGVGLLDASAEAEL